MDYQKLANAMIDALRQSTQSGLNLLDVQRHNQFEDFNNRGAKRGTLYSTAGRNMQSRYDATSYLPGKAELEGKQLQQEIGIKSDIIDTKNKIAAMNRAAKELNKIDDNYFSSLLV